MKKQNWFQRNWKLVFVPIILGFFTIVAWPSMYHRLNPSDPVKPDTIPKTVQKVDSNSGQVIQQSGNGNTSVQQSGKGNRNNSPNINNSKSSKQEIKGKNVVVGTNNGIVGDVSVNAPKLFSEDELNGALQCLTDFQSNHPSVKIFLGKTINCNSQDAFNQFYDALKGSKLNFQANVNLEGITSPLPLTIDTSTPGQVRIAIGTLR